MINGLLLTAPILIAMAAPPLAQERAPFGITSYGHFQRMMHRKNTSGVVDIAEATSGVHLYGMGALAGGTGEITLLLERQYFDLNWHAPNGLLAESGGHKLLVNEGEHQADNPGQIVGMYLAASHGVFTHPGESWHLHLMIAEEGKAGHVDTASLRAGAILKLPVS